MSCMPFAYEMMCTPALGIMNKWFTVEPLKATILTDACIGTFQSPAAFGSRYNNILVLIRVGVTFISKRTVNKKVQL